MRCCFCKPMPGKASTTGNRESLGPSPLQEELDGTKLRRKQPRTLTFDLQPPERETINICGLSPGPRPLVPAALAS